jgi:hypothetical protein
MVQLSLRPIEVQGVPLFRGTSTCGDSKRMFHLSLYRNENGYLFLASFTSTLKREIEHHALGNAANSERLAQELRGLHPEKWVRGYPSAIQFKAKQKALREEIVDRWDSLVSNALRHLSD